MGTSRRLRRIPTGGLRNALTIAVFVLAGLIVIAFLLWLASDTPLGVLPVAGALWVVLAPVPAFIAGRNGRSFVGYLLLSLLLSPVIGIGIVLVLGRPQYLRMQRKYRPQEWVIPL